MKNKINNIIDRLNLIIIICLIILIPITFFINYFSLFHFDSTFNFKIHHALTFVLPIEIIIYFYKIFTRQIRMNVFDLLIYVLILLGLISTICASDINLALWGSQYRFEGFIQICTYYFLFLNSRLVSKKELVTKVINCLIIIGIIQFVYSFLQVFVRGDYIFVKREFVSYRASGFIGHPNMLGSYVVLTLLLAMGMYFLSNRRKKFYLISSILLYVNLILTQSTGPFYGFLVAVFFMFSYLLYKKKIHLKQILVSSAVMIVGLVGVTFVSEVWCENKFNDVFDDDFTITGDIKLTFLTFGQVITGKVESNEYGVPLTEEYGSNRIWVWTRSLRLVPKYWLYGVGIDHLGKMLPEVLTEEDLKVTYLSGAYFDRAHNEYLHLLVTQGVFAFVAYISLLITVFITGFKSKNTLVLVLLFSFVGYAAQAFTNISVYNVAPFYYIVMGMLAGLASQQNTSEEKLNV